MREPLLFINYRTADTGAAASGLARALKRELEPGQIFIDYLGIEGGEPWKAHLRERVERATILFALIGKDWLRTADPETRLRMLDQEDDWVRWEIECCLKRGTKIVPILVDDAPPLEQYDLPASIQPIAGLQTRPFRTTVAFESDVKRLVNLLQNEGFLRQAHPWRVSPDSIYNRIELHRFVGRDWLATRLDEFLSTQTNGYFVVEAQSGMGKTAFLAHLVETRGYIHHFVELQPGAAGIIPGLRNLAAQIVRAFGLEPEWIDDLLSGIGTRADFLERLLVVAASRGRTSDPVVIVVDGLNEAGTPETQNVLGLPRKLPEGFFFVVSQRPVEVRLQTESAREIVTIDAADEANLRDVAAYVQNSLPEDCSAASELVRRSHGNWVYIHHVCREIREGNRDPHDHEGLPQGLWQYYARFWMQWRSSHQDRWRVSHLPLLCTLSAAQESLTLSSLSELAGVEDGALYGLMTIDWRPFMTVTLEADGEHFELYHASLRDFAGGFAPLDELTSAERAFANELSATARERHAGIAELWLQRWGGTKLNELRTRDGVNHRNDYGWRHVVEHLALAGEEDVLESLLRAEWTFHEEIPNLMPGWMGRLARWARGRKGATHLVIPRNAWFESHARSGDLALFLEDWARATRARRLSGKSGPAGHATQDRQIVLELAAFLVKNSTRDAALRVPPGILIALVRSGRWSSDQAIAYARQVADSATRAQLLTEISHRDGTMRPALIRDAIEAIESLEMPDKRVVAFARLLHRCPDEGRDAIIRRAFNVLPKLEATAFVENAPRIAPYLAPSHWEIYLAPVNGLRTPLLRLRALAASAAASNTASLLEGALIQARKESLEDAETATYAERSLALAVVASLSTGAEAAKYADSSLEAAALVIETPGPTLEEEAYEAVAVVASAFAERVPGDLLASTIESLLSIRYPGEPSPELVLLAMSRSITTVEQQRSKLAARLISVAPAPTMRKIEAAVLRTKARFHDWYPYRYLARRYAELGDTRRALRIVRKIGLERDRNETLGEIAGNLDEEGVRAGLAIVDAERTRLARVKTYSDMRHFEVEQAEVGLGAIVGLLPRLAPKTRRSHAFGNCVPEARNENGTRFSQDWPGTSRRTRSRSFFVRVWLSGTSNRSWRRLQSSPRSCRRTRSVHSSRRSVASATRGTRSSGSPGPGCRDRLAASKTSSSALVRCTHSRCDWRCSAITRTHCASSPFFFRMRTGNGRRRTWRTAWARSRG